MDKNQISAILGGVLSAAAYGKDGKAKPKLNMIKEAMVGAAAAGELSKTFLTDGATSSKENELYELRGKLRGYSFGMALIPIIDAGQKPLFEFISAVNGDFASFDINAWLKETSDHFSAQRSELREKVHSAVRENYKNQQIGHPIFANLQRFAEEDADEILEFIQASEKDIGTMLATIVEKYQTIFKELEQLEQGES